jgi:hypothetical protein
MKVRTGDKKEGRRKEGRKKKERGMEGRTGRMNDERMDGR